MDIVSIYNVILCHCTYFSAIFIVSYWTGFILGCVDFPFEYIMSNTNICSSYIVSSKITEQSLMTLLLIMALNDPTVGTPISW